VGNWPKTEVLQRLLSYGVAAASAGVTLTMAGAINTKSAWTELTSSTPFDSFGITVQGGMLNIGSFDVGLGGAGSEQIIVPDFYQGFRLSGLKTMHFPIAIPAGSRIAGRYQNAQILTAARMNVLLSEGDVNRGFSQIVTYGFVSGTSRGTEIDPGSTANTKGAWVELVASTGKDIRAFAIMIGDQGLNRGSVSADWLIDIGIGAAGDEQVLIPNWWAKHNYAGGAVPLEPANSEWFWQPIPAGSRVSARAQSSWTTASTRKLDVVLHAIV
jgi:hypothetical protein